MLALAIACIFPETGLQSDIDKEKFDSRYIPILSGLCNAFLTLKISIELHQRRYAFELEDFKCFLQSIRILLEESARRQNVTIDSCKFRILIVIEDTHIIGALRRNFNGVSEEEFTSLSHHFLSCAGIVSTYTSSSYIESRVLESIQHNINCSPKLSNSSPPRYILLLDKTKSESAVSILFSLDILHRIHTDVYLLAGFFNDIISVDQMHMILQIKESLEKGRTVVLSDIRVLLAFSEYVARIFFERSERSRAGVGNESGDIVYCAFNIRLGTTFSCMLCSSKCKISVSSYILTV